jgi:hypothetical protein
MAAAAATSGGDDAGRGRDVLCGAARGMQAFASGEINWLLVLLVVRLADVADEGMRDEPGCCGVPSW